jgi:hypothetical protein
MINWQEVKENVLAITMMVALVATAVVMCLGV